MELCPRCPIRDVSERKLRMCKGILQDALSNLDQGDEVWEAFGPAGAGDPSISVDEAASIEACLENRTDIPSCLEK